MDRGVPERSDFKFSAFREQKDRMDAEAQLKAEARAARLAAKAEREKERAKVLSW